MRKRYLLGVGALVLVSAGLWQFTPSAPTPEERLLLTLVSARERGDNCIAFLTNPWSDGGGGGFSKYGATAQTRQLDSLDYHLKPRHVRLIADANVMPMFPARPRGKGCGAKAILGTPRIGGNAAFVDISYVPLVPYMRSSSATYAFRRGESGWSFAGYAYYDGRPIS